MSQLILWNDTPYLQTLSKKFGRENVITGKDDFKPASIDWNKYSSLIVLCELKWTAKDATASMQHLQGIELVKELRRIHNLTLPVLFLSFHSRKEIFNAEREILTAIGHDFFRLPARPDDFIKYLQESFFEGSPGYKLSVMELNDIKSFYCNKEGILSQELHHLNRYLNYEVTEANHDSVYAELSNAIKKIHELFMMDASQAIISFHALFPKLSKANISEAVNHIIRVGNTLRNKYGIKSGIADSSANGADAHDWKVLFLDDEIDENHELIKCMKRNGMNVICVHTAEQADKVFKQDVITERKIMVVIADYRLYDKTGEVKRHQKIQGYKFLKDISATDHIVRLVAFSGLQRKFLLNSFKHYNLRTEVKSKIDYLSDDHALQMFCNEIVELAEENREAIESFPSKCAGFKNNLEEAYIRLRMNPAYDRMEREISLIAKEYVRIIQQQVNDKEEIRIGAIENIKSPLAKPKTIKDKVTGEVIEKIYDEAYFNRFMNYLTARRISLWLYAANKKGKGIGVDSREISRKIAEIITDQKYPTDAYRQIISTNLGLSLDDFPFNITVEEKYWLHYEMEIPVIRDTDTILPLFEKCSGYVKEFILKNDFIKEMIVSQSFKLNFVYKGDKKIEKNKTEIDFRKDFSPNIKTPSALKEVYWLLNDTVKDDDKLKGQLDKTVTFIRRGLQVLLEETKSIFIFSLYLLICKLLQKIYNVSRYKFTTKSFK